MKDALRGLDDIGPDDAVFQRARQGPRRPEPSTGPSQAQRGLAAVTALVVFGVAAGFAWRTWNAADVTPAEPNLTPGTVVPLGADGSTLWPEWTAAQLADAQNQADAGKADRALDPLQVTRDFAEAVLGWPNGSYVATVVDTPATGMTVRLDQLPASCPSPLPGEVLARICSVPPGTEEVTLAQPGTVGDGGIWAVTQVIAPTASIDAAPGQVVENGGSISGRLDVAEGLQGASGSLITNLSGSAACSHSDMHPTNGGAIEISLGLPPEPDQGPSCGLSLPAFVWASTSIEENDALRNIGPFLGGPSSYASLTAFPVVVALPESGPQVDLSMYTDPMGWSVSYPTEWIVSPLDIQDKVGTQGVVIASGPNGVASPNAATPAPVGPDLASAPSDLVVLGIRTTSGGPPVEPPVGDDTPIPLSATDLKVAPGTCTVCPAFMHVQINGVGYELVLWEGRDASEADITAARAIIESFQGVSLQPGTITSGWTPVPEPAGGSPIDEGAAIVLSGTPALQQLGVMYLMHPSRDLPLYALDLVPDTCGEGQDQRWDGRAQQIRVSCPDGTLIVYDAEGLPDAANPPGADSRLSAYPVIRSWDGQLLLGTQLPYSERPQWSWHF